MTPHELHGGADVVDRLAEPRQAVQAIVHGKPVVAGPRQQFEKLPSERDPASGVPTAAVKDDDGWTSIPGLLDVGIERKRRTVDATVDDLAAHPRDEVISILIPYDYWKTLPGRGAREPREEDPGGECARQDERPM